MTARANRLWVTALLSWGAMVIATAVLVYANATITGRTGDSDIKTAEEAAFTVAFVLALPLAVVSALVLLPLGAATNWLLRGNYSGWITAMVGVLLALPAFAILVVALWFVGGLQASPLMMMKRAAASHDPIPFMLLTVCMIGGAIVSLDIRRRVRAIH